MNLDFGKLMVITIMAIPGVSKDTTQTTKPGQWRAGTVTEIIPEAIGMRSYSFMFDNPVKHDAGQHYELRLTAEDGYQAARLYSAAMPANGTTNMLELTIARMDHGEISPYIFNNLKIGSQVEIRGPFGRHFVWTPEKTEPLLLIGGGTGIIPLRAIRLAHQYAAASSPIRLLYSVHTYYDMAYKYELFPRNGHPADDVTITFTDTAPYGWDGWTGRIDSEKIHEILDNFVSDPAVYICGPTPFVETAADLLVVAGIEPEMIKAERFGPTASR
jgi:ferredoxin-NADP reductase